MRERVKRTWGEFAICTDSIMKSTHDTSSTISWRLNGGTISKMYKRSPRILLLPLAMNSIIQSDEQTLIFCRPLIDVLGKNSWLINIRSTYGTSWVDKAAIICFTLLSLVGLCLLFVASLFKFVTIFSSHYDYGFRKNVIAKLVQFMT